VGAEAPPTWAQRRAGAEAGGVGPAEVTGGWTEEAGGQWGGRSGWRRRCCRGSLRRTRRGGRSQREETWRDVGVDRRL
jgi:hypothetical protein